MQSSSRSGSAYQSLVRSLVIITFVYLASGLSEALARPEYFRFTAIADTSDHLFSNLNFPCLNNLSRIAFTGRLSSGVEGVFSRVNLGGFDTLADSGTSNFVDFGLDCSINHNAMIEFVGLKQVSDGFDTVVLRGTGISSSPLIDSTGTFKSFSGFQLNIVGKTVLGAQRAADNASVILVKGVGQLTGPQRIVAPGSGAISLYSSFATNPTINSSGTVAFAAFKNQNHTIHILTVTEAGLVSEFLSDQGPFIGVGDAIINNSGSIAFHGTVAGGERGVWRIDQVNGQWSLTQLASSSTTPCVDFDAVAINDFGAVAFACRDFNSFAYVHLSDQFGLHRILGPGSQLFGRRVSRANIGREAINSDKRIAVLVDFDGGSSAIVRVEPTFIPPDLISAVSGAFQLEVSSDGGGGPSITTPINTRPKLLMLSFDMTFPSRATGELHVMLGDKLLKSLAATPPGVHQHLSIPIDLRKDSRTNTVEQLHFEITGKSAAVVQISNVVIPGVISDSMNSDADNSWHIDTSKGGHASMVDTTPFPVRVEVSPDSMHKTIAANHPVSVAILSSDGFDATHDIDRSTLTVNGALLEPETKQAAAKASSRCVERDVNADKLPDLVCDVILNAPSKDAAVQSVHVAAISIHGWTVAGSYPNSSVAAYPEASAP